MLENFNLILAQNNFSPTPIAIKTPIKYIIEESGLFQNIKNSWDIPTVAEGKLAVCTRMCAADFNRFGAQFQFNEGNDSDKSEGGLDSFRPGEF